jgi:hypothetical protein
MKDATDGGQQALESRLAELEVSLNEQVLVLETQARRDQDTCETEAAVQRIQREIADLRTRMESQP